MNARPRAGAVLDGAAIAFPAALAAVLCLYAINSRSLGFDEAASVTIAAQHGAGLAAAIARDGGNMAAYYAGLHVLIGALGNGALVVRLPSALAGTATVALVGLLAVRLFDRRVALASGLLAAVSLSLVYWGQDARGYAPMVALVTASFLAFAVLVEGDSRPASGGRSSGLSHRRSARWAWIAYTAFTTLAVYVSFVAMLVVPAQLVTLLWRRRAWRAVASALAVSAVGCVPLVVLAAGRGSGQLFWVPRPSITAAEQVGQALSSAALTPSIRASSTTAVLEAVTAIMLLGVAAAIGRRLWRRADRRAAWGQTLVLSWLVVPVALAWLESLVGQPIFLPRNLLSTVPAVALALGWAVARRGVPAWTAWSLLAGLIALRTLQLVPSYGVSPENWRAASAHVLARAQPRDCIAFYPADGRMAFQYYVGAGSSLRARRAPRSVLPRATWGQVAPYVERYLTLPRSRLSRLPAECPRLWFVSSHQGQRDGPARSRANRAQYLMLLSELTGEYPDRRAVSFGYASPVRVELLAR